MGNGFPTIKQIIDGPRPFKKEIKYTAYNEETGDFVELKKNQVNIENQKDPLYFLNDPKVNPSMYKAFRNGFGATAVVGVVAFLFMKRPGFTIFRVTAALYGTMFITTLGSYQYYHKQKVETEWLNKQQLLQQAQILEETTKEVEDVVQK